MGTGWLYFGVKVSPEADDNKTYHGLLFGIAIEMPIITIVKFHAIPRLLPTSRGAKIGFRQIIA